MSEIWGYHFIIDGMEGDKKLISDSNNIQLFVDKLVHDIDMKAYGETFIERFATHDPFKGGYSMFQMIETSNISGHFVDATGDFYIDVFSCKDFDLYVVEDLVRQFFKPSKMNTRILYRDARNFQG